MQTLPPVGRSIEVKRDRGIGFAIAIALHIVLFTVGGALLIKPAEFGIDQGETSVEVDLLAAPAQEVKVEVPTPPQPIPPQVKAEFVEPVKEQPKVEEAPQVKPVATKTEGKNDITMEASKTATTQAQPAYLSNPAPVYPENARRLGQEGTVLLIVVVNPKGFPLSVELKESSGYPLLDRAAANGVKKWKFHPGYLGSMPVTSIVEIPIRFQLKK
jgi:protein TonB